MFGAIAGGIASALAGGAMSKLFGGGQKAASRSEERFSRNAETDLVCRLLLEKKTAAPVERAAAVSRDALLYLLLFCYFLNDTPTTQIYTLSLHDALPI